MALLQPPPLIRVVAAVIERDGRYLITQRRPNAVLPLLWEFPGGKVEAGESDEEALRREIWERLEVEVRVGAHLASVTHAYPHYVIELHLYECDLGDAEPVCKNVHSFAWVSSSEFDRYPFTPADEASVAKLIGLKLDHSGGLSPR
ncbi:MAG: (deoxy)nucleoside triphosphate pyrophosphohydrolase [Sandaracinaceae bacterium]|nr:(deoxy)nucleoside triphosphate pyrophosphohydrolase [Sandaracinaceae bacterium]MDW8245903.1 (deoxy)nucleoside triphosphate pyrophosphohydrolase [Sandaracinaceae bacterium]